MKVKRLIAGVALLVVGLWLAGCTPPARKAEAGAPEKRVKILAYINVTSGCQQATVDFLKSLPNKYAEVGVELVDFGDGGAGADRWHASGLRCMAINVNGTSLVRYPIGGKMKMVAFRAPASLNWTHQDLEEAVQAALQGKLQPVTEEEFMNAPETPTAPQPGAK